MNREKIERALDACCDDAGAAVTVRSPTMNQEKIERALDACYDAILAPETWPDALRALARSVDAVCTMFYPRNPDPASPSPVDPNRPLDQVPISHDFGELLVEYARNKWYLNHYRAARGFPLLDSGQRVVLEHDMATDDERKTLRHYNELYLKFGFPGYAMVGLRVEGRPWVVPMLRATSQEHFMPEDAARLAGLSPHLARMIRLSDRFALQHAKAELDTLDRLACAAALIDWRGMVVRVNAQADALLGTDLRLCRGMLVASDPRSNKELQGLVAGACAANGSRTERPAGRMLVRRLGRTPLAVEALPVAGLAADAFSRAHAILIITDPEVRPQLPEDTLRALFGFSLAEARLASRLGGGESLSEAADQLGVGKETARSQLKAIFGKTGARRQSDLVALLVRLTR